MTLGWDQAWLSTTGTKINMGTLNRGARQAQQDPHVRLQGEVLDAGTRDGREGENPAAGLGVQQGTRGRSSDSTKWCPEQGHRWTDDNSQTSGERVGLTRCVREIRGSNRKREE